MSSRGLFTRKQREILMAMMNLQQATLKLYAAESVRDVRRELMALRQILLDKNVFTEEEWNAAVEALESQQAILNELDSDVRRLMAEARQDFEVVLSQPCRRCKHRRDQHKVATGTEPASDAACLECACREYMPILDKKRRKPRGR